MKIILISFVLIVWAIISLLLFLFIFWVLKQDFKPEYLIQESFDGNEVEEWGPETNIEYSFEWDNQNFKK